MGIRERVLIYGGTTTIDSEPGRGTTLSMIIPVTDGADSEEASI
jgi:signal transduction histidine kinase